MSVDVITPEKHTNKTARRVGLLLVLMFNIVVLLLIFRRPAEPGIEPIRPVDPDRYRQPVAIASVDPEPSPRPGKPLQLVPQQPEQTPDPHSAAMVMDAIVILDPDQVKAADAAANAPLVKLGEWHIEGENETPSPVPATPPPNEATPEPADQTPRPNTPEQRRAEEEALARELAQGPEQAARAIDRRTEQSGSPKIADRIQAAALHQKARKYMTTPNGTDHGIVRTMDITDAPTREVDTVFARYGIKIVVKRLDAPEDGGYDFLDQAKTSSGTFHSSSGTGVFQVFSYSQPAVARMMQLEAEEIKRKGFDPASSRVVQVEFGIVRNQSGYDLGIRTIEIVPIPVPEGAK